MESETWTVADAKARFSELVESARTKGPQTITKNGRKAVVVVSVDEWERKAHRVGSLAEFFARSPLPGSELTVGRSHDAPRPDGLCTICLTRT